MVGFLDRLNTMVVNTISPGRVAKVRFNRNEGIRLEWGSRDPLNLSAEELSGEVTRAVVAALTGAEQGTSAARRAVRAESGRGPEGREREPRVRERRRMVHARVQDIQVRAHAAQKAVTVDWRGRTDVEVRISRAALARLDAETLRDAVNQALESARGQHGLALAAIFSHVYKFDQFGQKWRQRR
ncbi:hypothetical protein [Stackebrandtia nassauensis]|uniref:Uncharacterized protein n=1 Tax=Stackebrandtia nassauensis (strain DSM 44728 / CIP 108903 / NRRL B-16338 / NBRC 102104 / LLR-40K-21) TaxID=446470 RepID=D3Q275_STANL|nr:hypothetical protein [Stackebrandtia nassauensis]ADD43808.1 hypothetical protein Snas_4157 [Stackebrandtia nassauensis DSM 44728]